MTGTCSLCKDDNVDLDVCTGCSYVYCEVCLDTHVCSGDDMDEDGGSDED